MQYHLNGYRSGDPSITNESTSSNTRPDKVDVLIVGCGPAGLTLAAQLAAFPDLAVRITERKSGPLEVGQADGIACRSVEMFEALGFAEKVLKEAYWVNEVAFWRPDPATNKLHRADRIQDVEDDLSEMPHVILNQARVHDFCLESMRNSANRLEPDYNRELITLTRTDDADYPIVATFKCIDGTESIRARYVVGCDGARSTVRKFIGQQLKGESARQLWGVMDVLAVTNFPDVRLKCVIQSADQGSMLIIPREGGYMVRMYIELDELHGDERTADRNVSSELLVSKAAAILAPYTLDVKDIVWWSAYEIGQRVCDSFDDNTSTPNIFIAGDACHTHSPKAGQGMNVSMADAFNLGWKLAAVLRGQASPALLQTYNEERRAMAKELIDFDRDMAKLFSAEAAQFQSYFKKHGRYTAGVETCYDASLITATDEYQSLATGLKVGMRFHSAPVIRVADGKPMQLGHVLKADGRWRLIAFADDAGGVARLCEFLTDSRLVNYEDVDSVIDVRAVFQQSHRKLMLESMPGLLLPAKGKFGLIDYEKIFCADVPDIYDLRGIDREHGALVVVRPDQYIAHVLPLGRFDLLPAFFNNFMVQV